MSVRYITGPTMQVQVDCRKGAWVAGQDIDRMLDLLCAITSFDRDDMAAAYAIWNAFRPITAVELHYLIFVCALDDYEVRAHNISVAMFAHLSTMDWHWEFPEAQCARIMTIQEGLARGPKPARPVFGRAVEVWP